MDTENTEDIEDKVVYKSRESLQSSSREWRIKFLKKQFIVYICQWL